MYVSIPTIGIGNFFEYSEIRIRTIDVAFSADLNDRALNYLLTHFELKCQWSARRASHHPAFLDNCQAISHTFYSLINPVLITSAKIPEREGSISLSSFYG